MSWYNKIFLLYILVNINLARILLSSKILYRYKILILKYKNMNGNPKVYGGFFGLLDRKKTGLVSVT